MKDDVRLKEKNTGSNSCSLTTKKERSSFHLKLDPMLFRSSHVFEWLTFYLAPGSSAGPIEAKERHSVPAQALYMRATAFFLLFVPG